MTDSLDQTHTLAATHDDPPTDRHYDVIIIGAGINGAGIARDAAMRGLHVLLLDKGDIASGTTSWSSRLIHGGLRYLEFGEVGLVRESLRERERLLRSAPHLVMPLPLMIPIYESDRRGKTLVRAGMVAYDALSLDKSLSRHRMLSAKTTLRRAPGLQADGLTGSALYYDAQVPYAERLAVENALDAAAHGATIRTYARVDRLLFNETHTTVSGVTGHDVLTGKPFTATAPVTINVAGPWVDAVLIGAPDSADFVSPQTSQDGTGPASELDGELPAPEIGAAPQNDTLKARANQNGTGDDSRDQDNAVDGPRHPFLNATGQFVRGFVAQFRSKGPAAERLIGGTKGSHIVVEPFPGAPQDALYVEARRDGRPFFIIPWNGLFLIGTTDLRYRGNLDHVEATQAEIDYLIDETNRVLPSAQLSRVSVLYTYSGVRPLPYEPEGAERGITRRHLVHDHAPNAEGLLSVIGGKLTTYRELAEHAVNDVYRKLDRPAEPAQTAKRPLPGSRLGDDTLRRDDLTGFQQGFIRAASAIGLNERSATHLLTVYGTRAAEVLALAAQDDTLLEMLDPASGAVAAEVVFAFDREYARTLSDVLLRRTMIGYGPDSAIGVDERAAAIGVAHLGWNAARADAEVAAYREYIRRYHPRSLGVAPSIENTPDSAAIAESRA